MSVLADAQTFLSEVGANLIDSCAYDTAWVAALRAPGRPTIPQFPACLDWLRTHQHGDGSWGAPWPCYHDRLISTLRAVLTLDGWRDHPGDAAQIEQGIGYIWRAAGRLAHDPSETVGFELLFPALLDEAATRNLPLPYMAFGGVLRRRATTLAQAPLALAYDYRLPLATTLEALGDRFDPRRAGRVPEPGGGVAVSPSATAFLLRHRPGDSAALAYVERAAGEGTGDHGAPTYWPLETWERSWALLHFQHAVPDLYHRLPDVTRPLLQFLAGTRHPDGWTATMASPVKDGGTTAVCFAVLGEAGYDLDPQVLYQYEEARSFRCHLLERAPSVSANAHVLDALRYCDPATRQPRVEKVIAFLRETRHPGGFWFDKWHISPYYATSHVVLAARDFAPDLVAPAIDWIIQTAWPDGGWGHYHTPTQEETAYAVLALLAWRDAGHRVPRDVLERGVATLQAQWSPTARDYPPLWIGKGLLAPVQIVQSAILAALLGWESRR
jgi:halimadienyl-diphosphate synthase